MLKAKGIVATSDRGYSLFVIALVMVVFSALFVAARLSLRIRTARFGKDDVLIAIALVCSIMLTATIDLAVANGYGKHSSELTSSEKKIAFKWFFIAQVFYKLALGFTKTSIVSLYIRIFVTEGFQRAGHAFLAIITCWATATILATILQCIPVTASWDKSIENKRCIDQNAFWYAFAATNTITDFAIFLLPIYPVLQLKLNKRDKIGLLLVFALGAFVCVTSIIRTIVVTQTSAITMDESYDFIPRSNWTLVESNMGIICACLPMLKSSLPYLVPQWLAGSRKDATKNTYVLEDQLRPSHSYTSQLRLSRPNRTSDESVMLSTSMEPFNETSPYPDQSKDDSYGRITKTTKVVVTHSTLR